MQTSLKITFLVFAVFLISLSTGSFSNVYISTKYQILDDTNNIENLDSLDSKKGYFFVEIEIPVSQETFELIKENVDGVEYFVDSMYIVKAGKDQLKNLKDKNVVKRIWHYASESNIEAFGIKDNLELANKKYNIILFDSADAEAIEKISNYATIEKFDGNYVKVSNLKDLDSLKKIAEIEGVELVERNIEDKIAPLNDIANQIVGAEEIRNRINLFGEGQIIALTDTGLDTGVNDQTMHDDFEGRILNITDIASCIAIGCSTSPDDREGHGTHVAGILLGNGNKSGSNTGTHDYNGFYAGAAPESNLIFQAVGNDNGTGFNVPFPLDTNVFGPAFSQGARIHSNSWGFLGANGNYTSVSQAVDKFMRQNQDYLIVFSAGNLGPNLNTITPPGTAKNIITVAASENYRPDQGPGSDNPDEIWQFGSRGPTTDGRIKPDLSAPGVIIISTKSSVNPKSCFFSDSQTGPSYSYCSGTSMASPRVSGLSSLVREFYVKNKGTQPSSALVKATLINGAQDMGFGITSNETGWGRVNITKAIPENKGFYFQDNRTGLITGRNSTFDIIAAPGKIEATLVYTDRESSLTATKNLVNNLNLIVTDPLGKIYNGNDFAQPFNDTTDSTNNVERILIQNNIAGRYQFTIQGVNIPFGPQSFAIVVTYDKYQPPKKNNLITTNIIGNRTR